MKAAYDVLAAAISEHYPGATFEGKSSFISADTMKLPEPDRFLLLARKVVRAIDNHQDVHLYGHSLGAAEVARTLFLVKKMRPDLKGDHPDLKHLHIVLMSPLGLTKNLNETATMLARTKNIVTAGSEKSGHIYGLETVAYLPLKMPGASQDVAQFLPAPEQAGLVTRIFAEESQRGTYGGSALANEVESFYLQPDPEVLIKRFARLSDDEKKKLTDIDNSIFDLLKLGAIEEVRTLFTERGRLLSKYSQETYAGLPIEEKTSSPEIAETEEPPVEKATLGLYFQAMLASFRLMASVVSGNTYRQVKPLYDAGVDVSFLVPEYDALVKMSEIVDFLDDDETEVLKRTTLIKTATHSSTSVGPKVFADVIKRLANSAKPSTT